MKKIFFNKQGTKKMKKIITAKHFFLYKTVSNETFSQLRTLEQEFPHLTSTRIVLRHQKGTFSGEMVVKGRKVHIMAKSQGKDLPTVIDEMIQKAGTQIRKNREKKKHTRRKSVSAIEQHIQYG